MVQNGPVCCSTWEFITNVANELEHWESIGKRWSGLTTGPSLSFWRRSVCHIYRLNGHNDDLWTLNFQTKVQLLTIKCHFTVSFQTRRRITSARILSFSSSSQVCFLCGDPKIFTFRYYLHDHCMRISAIFWGFDLTRYYLALQWCSARSWPLSRLFDHR